MKWSKFLLTLFLTSGAMAVSADPVEEGKALFLSRCASCHNVNRTMTGPALAGIDQRRSMTWIIQFVHSPQAMISKGDKDAVALYKQFGTVMPDQPGVSEADIRQIVAYIQSEAKAGVESGPFVKPAHRPDASRPLSYKDIGFFTTYLLAVGLLVMVLLWGVQVKSLQQGEAL